MPTIVRNDIHGVQRCPQDLVEYLLSRYGENPYGEPVWRIVLAQNVYNKWAGKKKMKVPAATNQSGLILPRARRFDRQRQCPTIEVGGMWEKRKYPRLTGWILQRWFSPDSPHFGKLLFDPQTWLAPENQTPWGPKLGPFPTHGDYEYVWEPFQQLPSRREVDDAIAAWWSMVYQIPESLEQREREATDRAIDDEEAQHKALENWLDDFMRDRCAYIWSSSLEAGRIREEVAKRCGIREHVGN